MSTEVIIPGAGPENDSFIPTDSIVDGKDLSSTIQEDFPPTTVDKIKQDDILETPPSPGSLQNPPPPYSQWDELSLEQLLEKSKEVLGNTEYLASGDEQQKDGKMLDKMTQLESLVSSLQAILNDQTFAMHDLRSQLSDIQTVLKKMQDKQETMTSEEVMKQVITMKALTENILASSEVKKQLDASVAAAAAVAAETTYDEEEAVSISQLPTEIVNSLPNIPPSEILNTSPTVIQPSPVVIQSSPASRQTSRVPSRVQSRTTSRAPSRTPSRAPSRAPSTTRSVSNVVSPSHTPMSLSRSSSKYKLESSTSDHSFKNDIQKIDECDSDEELESDPSFNRMADLINSLLTEATTAVEAPVKGREKKRRTHSNVSQKSLDFGDINDLLDDLEEVDESDEYEIDGDESDDGISEQDEEDIEEEREERGRKLDKDKQHKRQKSRAEENFEQGMREFNKSMQNIDQIFKEFTAEDDMQPYDPCIQYVDPTNVLIQNPSEGLADLDDFSQQCRLLTRALILPFLHATHSFMSESLKANNLTTPRSMTSTTRTFMNLMYWTFLFTLGTLVLDAWLCEIAGRQVIRMVDLLKPEPFGFLSNNYEIVDDQQDGGFGVLGDGKKKNVKFRTGPKMKAVTWKGVETGVVGSGRRWLKDGMMNLKRKSRRLFTSGRWDGWEIFSRSTVGRFEDDCSDDSEEWEIVDFDSSDGEDSETEEDEIVEDPALVLRRRITNERSRRAGHVKNCSKKEINDLIENEMSTNIEQSFDMQEKIDPLFTSNRFLQESDDEYNENSEDVDLNIPGSYPEKFKWTPPTSPIVDVMEVTENVRRVRSVILRRSKRNGPFGGSVFCIMKTRKIKARGITSKDVTSVLKSSSSKSSPISKKKNSKSLPIPKRTWIRRNSI